MDAERTHNLEYDRRAPEPSADRLDASVVCEVERLLAGRTRHIRLNSQLARLSRTILATGSEDHPRMDGLGRDPGRRDVGR